MSEARVLSDAPWLRSGPAARVLTLLNGDGEEARVVGGAVRNALLKIPLGDIDIASLNDKKLTALRRLTGIVSQDTVLFNDTVRNNIAYGSADRFTDAQIRAAAEAD